jgi:hypothetical protein
LTFSAKAWLVFLKYVCVCMMALFGGICEVERGRAEVDAEKVTVVLWWQKSELGSGTGYKYWGRN